MLIPRPKRTHYFTPLRYPGGKTFMFEFFDQVIRQNRLRHVVYVEPFAGGAGAGLSLLLLEKVEQIVINDLDRAVYAFWRSVLDDGPAFIDRVRMTPISMDEWRRQRETFRDPKAPAFDLGFAAFYLNRTNHSGILTGGPIGGISQTGAYKLGARFNKDELIKRLRLITRYRDRIEVRNEDGQAVIDRYASNPTSFQYIDPPYFAKGGSLYMSFYKPEDHRRLAEQLNTLANANWILSYDNVKEIQMLYAERKTRFEFSLHYQAHTSRMGSELVVLSDALHLPASMTEPATLTLL